MKRPQRDFATALWGAALTVFAAAALQFGAGAPKAIACSCGPTPPPCEAYWSAPMVFLGTVTEVLAKTDMQVRFFFTALEGFEYRLRAVDNSTLSGRSVELDFSLAKGPRFITMVLAPGE